MLAKVLTGVVVGLDGALVDVEADIAPGNARLPGGGGVGRGGAGGALEPGR